MTNKNHCEPEARLINQTPHENTNNNKERARMCRARSVADQRPTALTEMAWDSIIDSPTVEKWCRSISALINDEARKAEPDWKGVKDKVDAWKKGLDVIIPQASGFGGDGKRKKENAQPKGLVMLDIYHKEYGEPADPEGLWQRFIDRGGMERWTVVLAHKSCSGRGLRIIFEQPVGVDIREAQEQMADFLGVKDKWDTSCTDMSRCSFVVPRTYIYYEDREKMFTPVEVTDIQPRIDCQTKQTDRLTDNSAKVTSASLQTAYDGLPLTEIAARWVVNRLGTTAIPVGQRNNTLHTLAYELTLITDNNSEVIRQALIPLANESHFPLNELAQPIDSAVRARKENEKNCRQGFPEELKQAIDDVKKDYNNDLPTDDGEEHTSETQNSEQDDNQTLPPLPPVIRELVGIAPEDFKTPTAIGSLAELGTVASNIRGTYLDGTEQAPVFQVVIEAPQASGKDTMSSKLTQNLLKRIIAHDDEVFAEENDYNSKRNRTQLRPGQTMPEPPRKPIQLLAANVSASELKMRASQSQGLIQIQVVSELDLLTQSRSRGAWADLTATYRLGFEGGILSQDYVNKETFNGRTPVLLSVFSLGTSDAVEKFYGDYSAHNGTASRTIFGYIPDQSFKSLPDWGQLTPAQQRLIDQKLDEAFSLNYDEEGKVKAPIQLNVKYVADAMRDWCEEQREQAALEDSLARDTFRRRAALIGFRAGLLAHWLWGNSRHKKEVIALARWVADYTIDRQIFKFGNRLEEDAKRQAGYKKTSEQQSLVLNKLGNTFTRQELYDVLQAQGNNSGRTVIHRLKKGGFIKENPDNPDTFMKVA